MARIAHHEADGRRNRNLPGGGAGACLLVLALVCTPMGSAGQTRGKTCADTLARIEKQLAAQGKTVPVLKIVPKGLAAGERVVGSCENGTQRIVDRTARSASATEPGSAPAGRGR